MLALSLFWVGVVLIVSAILMLFWDSFKQRKLWAFISLLLLVPLLIHLVLNWSSLAVRKAFYISIVGILAIIVSIVGGALSQLSFLPEHEIVEVLEDNIAPPEQAPLPNQEQADAAAEAVQENYDPLLTGSEYEPINKGDIVPEDVNKANPNATSASYQTLSAEERVHAINKLIRMTMTDGRVIEGKLTNVLDDAVLVESSVSGGSLGLSYNNSDIASIAVRLEAGEQLTKPTSDDEAESTERLQPDVIDQATQSVMPDVIEEVDQTIEEIETQVLDSPESAIEVIQPEMKSVLPEQETAADEILPAVESMVDDSKVEDSPIDDNKSLVVPENISVE